MNNRKTVLIITSHYPPNIGGVESHLHALVESLIERNWNVFVSTYQPLASKRRADIRESRKNLIIYRMPWVGSNVFHKLAKYPLLEFAFLFPGLLFSSLYVLFIHRKYISVIHAQGLVPGAIGIVISRLFNKRLVTSIHNIYFFPKNGLYPKVSKFIFQLSDVVLVPTEVAYKELVSIGVSKKKIERFRYWLSLKKFKPYNKLQSKDKLKWNGFRIFFVGRLIETKGVGLILKIVRKLNSNTNIVIAGDGPMRESVENAAKMLKNLTYLGRVENSNLPLYYSASDLVIVPSLVDEGWGFVAMEAISCGTPVLASNVGGLSDVVAPAVGLLVKHTEDDFLKAINYLYKNAKVLADLTKSTRKYALSHFGDGNVSDIIDAYGG